MNRKRVSRVMETTRTVCSVVGLILNALVLSHVVFKWW